MKRNLLIGLVLGAGLLTGCQSADKAESAAAKATPVNEICPIGGHAEPEMIHVAYKGKTIAFCCDGCVQDFGKMSEADKDKILAKAEGPDGQS